MEKICTQCSVTFTVSNADRRLLAKLSPTIDNTVFSVPEPTQCFDCRLQRRLAFYNPRSLYKRKCDLTGEDIVSVYSPDQPFTVYERHKWYGDDWDPLDFGRDFDFSKSFFEQFRSFMESVPLLSLAILGDNVNSDYTNDNLAVKNCYLIFDGEQAEDCQYGHTFVRTKSCMDFVYATECELCYQVVHCTQCYHCMFCRYCTNCLDSWFLRDCIGCKNCFGCANLRQKQYCIYNEQKTKIEYEEFMKNFHSTSYSALQKVQKDVENFLVTQPVKAHRGEQNISSTGDNINECKDSHECFDCNKMQDCRYCTDCLMGAKDCSDIHIWGDGMELCYESCVVGAQARNVIGSYYISQGGDNVMYSMYCSRKVSNLFGCIGLRHKSNCILNKQYSLEEYQELSSRIAKHMIETGEWGEFFPVEISGFGYNETMAQTFFPLTKKEVLEKGWQWSEYEPPLHAEKTIPADGLPDDTNDIPDDVLNWAIMCEKTAKPFKIVKKELQFYRECNLPLPRRHPDQRHMDRFTYKNPYNLWDRTCDKCSKAIQTTYSPDRPEKVYCEECYLAEVY